jgi:hypothetical protein
MNNKIIREMWKKDFFTSGGRGVASSNLVTPTNQKTFHATAWGVFFFEGGETIFST